MTRTFSHLFFVAFALLTTTFFFSGCVVDGGYGYGGGPGFGADYYEPGGYDYGGWGAGYAVGPYRGGGHPDHWDYHGGGSAHAWRAAPASHGVPSLPEGRYGGGRSGGSHGGGRGGESH